MNAMTPSSLVPKSHLLTVALEDYYQVGSFNRVIQRGHWYRFESRFELNARRAVQLLDRFEIKATFFVLGWIAERYPEIIRMVAERGHEIASKGYYHRSIRQMSPAEFREDLARSREALERASGKRVLGYRVAHEWFSPADLWALDVLAMEGYAYDSSICPRFRSFGQEPWRRFAHPHKAQTRELWEFPISTCSLLGWRIPIAGGNYLRQFPRWLVRRALAQWNCAQSAPLVMYFHAWELDPEQPRIEAISAVTRLRHYRNLDKMVSILEEHFRTYQFRSIAEHLGLESAVGLARVALDEGRSDLRTRTGLTPSLWAADVGSRGRAQPASRLPVTIIVPCFNEELILHYLANTLESVRERLGDEHELHWVFVDDGSTDATWRVLREVFGTWPDVTMLRHDHNRGAAAAILTGIRWAETEIVCSIDCDCTYDPHELAEMIPLLTADVDMVTASPYHPRGHVRNVPPWRLSLSKSASFLYRRVLRQQLFTYTSCFRVYRRSTVVDLELEQPGFLGIAEILGKLDLQGGRVVEYPTTLEVRMLGRSKMKILRTIAAHLGLLARLLWLRLREEPGQRAGRRLAAHAPAPALALAPKPSGPPDRTSVKIQECHYEQFTN